VPMGNGGVRYTDSTGVWFEECADEHAFPGKVLNGFIFSLFGLYDYAVESESNVAWTSFWEGVETLENNIHRYDTGFWSYYDLLYHKPSPLNYHKLHISQLRTLYEITGKQTFLYYSNKFESYLYPELDSRVLLLFFLVFGYPFGFILLLLVASAWMPYERRKN